ncbi:hypothetical protein Taro_019671 [Colocasia esculenta]|uniref:Circadian clock associated 1 n=1 Tax=Colocasia esculenta TaxID=4460 RepID=A0A843UWW5_COLES|nr:hypothetical protein [Colocasia esculenta]
MDIGCLHRLSIDTEVKLTEERKISQKQLQNCCMPPKNEVGSSKNYPKHVLVHSIDGHNNGRVENRGSDATNVTSVSKKVEVHTSLNFGTVPCISAAAGHNSSTSMSSVQEPLATYPPFMQFLGTQDACGSSSNISSTFSSLIVSTLLQNPAAHSAASLAASFWPTADIETPIGSALGTFVGGIPAGHTNHMAAIATATVAAASAWWATRGMLPFYHPFQSCFAFAPAPTSTIPRTETAQTTEDNEGREVEVAHDHLPKNQQNVDPQCSKALGTKSARLSSSVSDDSQGKGMAHAVQLKSPAHNHPNPPSDSHLPDSINARSKKEVDHSSCGSNALSNSEMEKAKVFKNLEEGKGEPRDVNLTHPSSIDTSNRRPRGYSNMSESWKEVSEEGRLAFQALFSRDILPQSFSPAHTEAVMGNGKEEVAAPPAELNSDACAPAGNGHAQVADRNCSAHEGIKIGKDPLNSGIGQGKLKSHRTGFKPYKRCSMEAKESKSEPVEEKCNKRIHMEGKTSM